MRDFISEAIEEGMIELQNRPDTNISCKCFDCKFCNRESFEEEFYCEIYETFVEADNNVCDDFEWREDYE